MVNYSSQLPKPALTNHVWGYLVTLSHDNYAERSSFSCAGWRYLRVSNWKYIGPVFDSWIGADSAGYQRIKVSIRCVVYHVMNDFPSQQRLYCDSYGICRTSIF